MISARNRQEDTKSSQPILDKNANDITERAISGGC